MVTLDEFIEKHKLKKRTVLSWIEKGYIKGVVRDGKKILIPKRARPLYTAARARKIKSVYKTIVKACVEGKGICEQLFRIEFCELDVYAKQLSQHGYIQIISENNIDYYYSTPLSEDFLFKSSTAVKIMCEMTKAITKGGMSAVLENVAQTS